MPHDANGDLIEKGCIVTMRFLVTDVQPQEDYCNVTLLQVGGPQDGHHPRVDCNSKLCVLEPTVADGRMHVAATGDARTLGERVS